MIKTKNKLIGLALCIVLILLSGTPVGTFAANDKVISTNKKSLSIKKSGKIKITSFVSEEVEITVKSSDSSTVKVSLPKKWKHDKKGRAYKYCKITGKKNGSVEVTITNNINKQKITIPVRVTGFEDKSKLVVTIQNNVPCLLKHRIFGDISGKFYVSKIEESHRKEADGTYSISVSITGKKTYTDGTNKEYFNLWVALYNINDEEVDKTGGWQLALVGEEVTYTYTFEDLKGGEYYLYVEEEVGQ